MATQTLEFSAGTGLTLLCKLFAVGSDTIVGTQIATEKSNDKNRYSVAFTDVPAGAYRLNAFVDTTGGFANEVYDLTLTTATFQPRSESFSAIITALGSIAVDNGAIASAVRSELSTELARVDVPVSSRLASSDFSSNRPIVPISALPFQVVRKYNNTAILRRFASFSWTLNNVGSLTGVQKIVFTIKDKRDSEADSASVLQIVASIPENAASDGVTYVNKQSGSAVRTSGKITVQAYMDDFVERHRIVIEASDKVTAIIDNYDNCTFDVKQIMADDSDILEEGILVIQGVSTRLISS